MINEDYFAAENNIQTDAETHLKVPASKSEGTSKNNSELFILQTLKVQVKRDEGLAAVGRND